MKRYTYSDLSKAAIQKLVQRNADPGDEIREAVEAIIRNVRTDDDDALIAYAYKFDNVVLMRLVIEKDELAQLASTLKPEEKAALQTAYDNIHKFHQSQLKTEDKVETKPGVTCWRELRPKGTAVPSA